MQSAKWRMGKRSVEGGGQIVRWLNGQIVKWLNGERGTGRGVVRWLNGQVGKWLSGEEGGGRGRQGSGFRVQGSGAGAGTQGTLRMDDPFA